MAGTKESNRILVEAVTEDMKAV